MKITQLIRIFLLTYPCLLLTTSFLFLDDRLVSITSVLLMCMESVTLWFFLEYVLRSASNIIPFAIFFIGIHIITFLIRFWSIVVDPLYLTWNDIQTTPNDLTLVAGYILIGTFVSIAGIVFGNAFWVSRRGGRIASRSYIDDKLIIRLDTFPSSLLILLMMTLYICMTTLLLYSRGTMFYIDGLLEKILSSLFTLDGFFFVLAYVSITRWRLLLLRQRLVFYAGIMLYVIARLLISSKAGIFYAGMIVLAIIVARYGDFRIKKIYIFACIILFPLIILTLSFSFDVARGMRPILIGHKVNSATEMISEIRNDNFIESGKFSDGRKLPGFLSRLMGIDSMLAVVQGEGQKAHSFSLLDDIKAVVNFLVPGNVFKRTFLSSQYFGIAYLGVPEYLYFDGLYTTYGFTLYGNCLAYFGPIVGLFAIAIVSLLITILFNLCCSGSIDPILKKGIFLYLSYFFVTSFGFDFYVLTFVKLSLSITTLFLLWNMLKKLKMTHNIPHANVRIKS